MKLPGYCHGCGKFRYVRPDNATLWKVAIGAGVPEGVCHECEQPPRSIRSLVERRPMLPPMEPKP
jgi:hypothetical protein